MINPQALARAGTLLLMDSGMYSDYFVIGLFVVEKTFVPFDMLEAYFEENPRNRQDFYFEQYRFIAYLVNNGYAKEVQYDRFFLTGYGRLDEIEYFPPIPEREK